MAGLRREWVLSIASMGTGSSRDGSEEGDSMVPSGVSGALSSLWSTSSDKDDTCVQWGLVR